MTLAGAKPITAPGWTGAPRTEIAVIDCDVHHSLKREEDLLTLLPRVYREQVVEQGFLLPKPGYYNVPFRANRIDLSDGKDKEIFDIRERGADYDLLREEHLDRWNVDYALLTGPVSFYSVGVIPDPDYAAALCTAFNDWTIEEWASRDSRLLVSLLISTSDPRQAAMEIDRLGGRPEVVAIILPTGSRRPYGNRFFLPIWEACERNGLAVIVHPGAAGAGMAGPPTGVGYPTYYIEHRMARPQEAMAHCASLICEGVFERFPSLKFAFIEVQQFWAPGLIWHMDADWKSLREQTPWLKKLPSEYFREHIKVGSQPLGEPTRPEHLMPMLEAMHADEVLIYCSDWPHWDWDDPATTFPRLPEDLHKRIFAENARDLLNL